MKVVASVREGREKKKKRMRQKGGRRERKRKSIKTSELDYVRSGQKSPCNSINIERRKHSFDVPHPSSPY